MSATANLVVLSIQIVPMFNSHEQPCYFIIAMLLKRWIILLPGCSNMQCCSRMITLLFKHWLGNNSVTACEIFTCMCSGLPVYQPIIRSLRFHPKRERFMASSTSNSSTNTYFYFTFKYFTKQCHKTEYLKYLNLYIWTYCCHDIVMTWRIVATALTTIFRR